MEKNAKIFVAGHRGLVGSAILRLLQERGYTQLICRTHSELDLTDQGAVKAFFEKEGITSELIGVNETHSKLYSLLYSSTKDTFIPPAHP